MWEIILIGVNAWLRLDLLGVKVIELVEKHGDQGFPWINLTLRWHQSDCGAFFLCILSLASACAALPEECSQFKPFH